MANLLPHKSSRYLSIQWRQWQASGLDNIAVVDGSKRQRQFRPTTCLSARIVDRRILGQSRRRRPEQIRSAIRCTPAV